MDKKGGVDLYNEGDHGNQDLDSVSEFEFFLQG